MLNQIVDVLKRGWLRWYIHMLQKGNENWIKKVMSHVVNDKRGKRRPRMNWKRTCTLSG